MSKILFVSDLHLDNWGAFSTTTKEGFNSRFVEQFKVLSGVLKYAEDHGYIAVFGGDLFNRRLLIPTDVLHLTYDLLSLYKIHMYFIVGNHDMYGSCPAATPLAVFSNLKYVNVITQATNVYVQPNTHISMVPYGEPIPVSSTKLPDSAYQILVAHYGIHEAKLGPSNYRMESDLTVKQIKEFGYDLALFGHIHKPQALAENVIVLGSAMAHSFHEVNEEKYFYVFDCEERKLVKYPTNAPKFLVHEVWSIEDFCNINLEDGNYHRVNILTDAVPFDDVKAYANPNVIISFTKQSQYNYKEEVEEQKGRSPEDEVEDYYNLLETDLEKEKLKKKSLDIIGGI